jgi:hypothetical protein
MSEDLILIADPPLVYIKPIKAASTSLDVFFQQFVMLQTPPEHLFEAASGQCALSSKGVVAARAPQKGLTTPWLSHMDRSSVEAALSTLDESEYPFATQRFTWVTSIRNPYRKLVSTFLYQFDSSNLPTHGPWRRALMRVGVGHKIKLSNNDLDFLKPRFSAWLHDYQRNRADDVFGRENSQNACDLFLRVENLDSDLASLCQQFELSPRAGVTHERASVMRLPPVPTAYRLLYAPSDVRWVQRNYDDWLDKGQYCW